MLPPAVELAKSSKLFSVAVSNPAENSIKGVPFVDTCGPSATAATPGAADNQTDQSSNEFAAVSVGSERSIDNVETASVQPGAAAPDTPSEWGSLALIAGIALVLLGGGGLAAVGMAASRKRV